MELPRTELLVVAMSKKDTPSERLLAMTLAAPRVVPPIWLSRAASKRITPMELLPRPTLLVASRPIVLPWTTLAAVLVFAISTPYVLLPEIRLRPPPPPPTVLDWVPPNISTPEQPLGTAAVPARFTPR